MADHKFLHVHSISGSVIEHPLIRQTVSKREYRELASACLGASTGVPHRSRKTGGTAVTEVWSWKEEGAAFWHPQTTGRAAC